MPGRSKGIPKAAKRMKTAAPAGTTKPSVNRRSVELALLLWMSERSDNEETRKRLSALESEIKDHYANGSLEQLLTERCDRETLLRALGFACGKPVELGFDNWFTKPGPQSLESLFGLEGREFSTLKGTLLKAADRIDDINRRFEFGVLLTTPHLQLFQGLPDWIRGYVSLLELAAKQLGRGAHFYRNMGKAILTLYVEQKTGRVHDEQVSALFAAVTDSEYSARNHVDWREEHKELLSSLSRLIPIFALSSVRSAIKCLASSAAPPGISGSKKLS